MAIDSRVLFLLNEGAVKGGSWELRVAKRMLEGPVTQNRRKKKTYFLSATVKSSKKREKISPGARLHRLALQNPTLNININLKDLVGNCKRNVLYYFGTIVVEWWSAPFVLELKKKIVL